MMQEYELKEELSGRIDPSACRYDIRATQLALKLKKVDPAHWATLEKGPDAALSTLPASTAGQVLLLSYSPSRSFLYRSPGNLFVWCWAPSFLSTSLRMTRLVVQLLW